MSRLLSIIAFLGMFLLVYLGAQFYVFQRLSGLLQIRRGIIFYVIAIAVALWFPIASFVVRNSTGIFSRIFYAGAASWLGAVFFLLCLLAIHEVVRLFVKIDAKTAGIAILILGIVFTSVALINALFIRVHTIELQIPKLEKATTIVQLSDIHVGTIHNSEYLKEIVDKTNALNPDMVLITGDLVDGSGPLSYEMLQPLEGLKAKTFFTTGNHEEYEGLDKVLPLVQRTGVQILRNELANYKGIQIVGIDNPGEGFRRNNSEISQIKINKSKAAILMFHPPSGLEDAQAAGISLQLSGHTHNGQIIPFNLLSRLAFPRVQGLYEYKGTYLYTTYGTGTWGPPMRLGSSNEIVLLKLKK
ncbi:MAG: metallophosphoesterase [Candidatus Woesearchaeota archaeon]